MKMVGTAAIHSYYLKFSTALTSEVAEKSALTGP